MSTLYKMNIECPRHETLLKYTKISSECKACYEEDDKKQGGECDYCDFYVHEECINLNIPSRHHKHPLELKIFPRRYYHLKQKCYLCQEDEFQFYRCRQCGFSICIPCARKPLIFNQAKAHKQELHQIPTKLSFICDACGLCSSGYPCICHQCYFIIHRECISLPRVIYINRHDHRISHVSSLGPGEWICGVCHEPVHVDYGAYSCLICSNYAVHSKCATNEDTWDGRELEGIPEEEEGKPFEVIDYNLFKHFSHQHNLKVSLGGLQEDKHCYACTLAFNSEKCYRCTQCDFILHDACANLPLRKRHPISTDQLNLQAKVTYPNSMYANYFLCYACLRYCTGFQYANDKGYQIDVRCASITDAFKHESHPHWLLPSIRPDETTTCTVCDSRHWVNLRCTNHGACEGFSLCFTCATLPTLVRHKYDDHPLSLCYGEGNVNSIYCCGVCEKEVIPRRGFYWCRDCNSTLHTKCVFKNLLHPRPGYTLGVGYKGTFELLPNDSLTRPTCSRCKNHCIGDFVLKSTVNTSVFMCFSCVFTGSY